IAPGMFSSERIFKVQLANGETYSGITPRHFCWNDNREPLGEKEPDKEVDGMVAARLIEQRQDGQCIVEVPDGEVLAVDPAVVVWERPTEIRPPGPPSRKELSPHVPV